MYWITNKLGTASKYELDDVKKLENVEVVIAYDIRDGEGNTPLQIKRKVWKISEITSKGKRAVIVCKGVCHNISVLVSGIFELDLKLDWN